MGPSGSDTMFQLGCQHARDEEKLPSVFQCCSRWTQWGRWLNRWENHPPPPPAWKNEISPSQDTTIFTLMHSFHFSPLLLIFYYLKLNFPLIFPLPCCSFKFPAFFIPPFLKLFPRTGRGVDIFQYTYTYTIYIQYTYIHTRTEVSWGLRTLTWSSPAGDPLWFEAAWWRTPRCPQSGAHCGRSTALSPKASGRGSPYLWASENTLERL